MNIKDFNTRLCKLKKVLPAQYTAVLFYKYPELKPRRKQIYNMLTIGYPRSLDLLEKLEQTFN